MSLSMWGKSVTIETLDQLYAELDSLYAGIEKHCTKCEYPDCVGYVWLLKRDEHCLFDLGVPLVQVNNGPTFIHSFPVTSEGNLVLSQRLVPCSQRAPDGRGCSIYHSRPLVCRLYPLGLETQGTEIVWALQLDCLYLRQLEDAGLLSDFERRARQVLTSLSSDMLREIVTAYQAVDAISVAPFGPNNYRVLEPIHLPDATT